MPARPHSMRGKQRLWTRGRAGWRNGFGWTTICRVATPSPSRDNSIRKSKKSWKIVGADGGADLRDNDIMCSAFYDKKRLILGVFRHAPREGCIYVLAQVERNGRFMALIE